MDELKTIIRNILFPKGIIRSNYWDVVKDKISKLIETKKYSEEEIKKMVYSRLLVGGFSEEGATKATNVIIPPNIKQSQEIINRLKSSSIKLPNKPLKLESIFESLSKELLYAPPHYEIDGYKIILTSDINANNYPQFVNTFRAGRIISAGKVSEMNDDFSQELIYKTMNKNKLKIDNNFYYAIFEELYGA